MNVLNFRAYDEDAKEWLTGSAIERHIKIQYVTDAPGRFQIICTLENVTIEQSTGRFDRDKNESFKGDCYFLDRFTDIYEVRWNDENAGFYLRGVAGEELKSVRLVGTARYIGNIHENPGLLDPNGKPGNLKHLKKTGTIHDQKGGSDG